MKINARKFSEIKKVILNPNARSPRWTYFMIRNLPFSSTKEIRCDLTIIPPYHLGREFNKTFGHIHRGGESETYKVLLGNALFVLQEMRDENHIEKILVCKAKRGDRITIPGEYYHESINRGRTPLILVNWLKTGTENDYSLIEKRCGFGYYVVANGDDKEFELVKNANYKEVPKAKQLT